MSSSVYLAIDLSSRQGTLALGSDNEGPTPIVEAPVGGDFDHCAALLGSLERLLKETGNELSDLKGIVVPAGPGSFTGLRIGLSTAKAFCHSLKIPLYLVNTAEARLIAFLASTPPTDNQIAVVTALTRDRAVLSLFTKEDDEWLLSNETVSSKSEIAQSLVLKVEEDQFPSKAGYLLSARFSSKTIQTITSFEELTAASPVYFGSSFQPPKPR